MKFAHPWVLFLIPVAWLALTALFIWGDRRRVAARARFVGDPLRAWAKSNAAPRPLRVDRALTGIALTLLLLTLARPLQFAPGNRTELQGVPFLIALDASRSMLATDVRPSRWAAVTNALDGFLARTRGDRIGLITFSGVAYLNAPLTFDSTALRTMLRYLDPNQLEDPGSSLTSAIERAGRYFATNQISPRLLLLISDGEDLAGSPVETARRLARQYQLQVVTMGVGTASGARVPLQRGGAARNSFGQEVVSRLNESNLQRMALATGGRYLRFGDRGESLEEFRREVLAPMAEAAAREDLQNYRERYAWPLSLAVLALVGKVLFAGDRRVIRRQPSPIRVPAGSPVVASRTT